MRSCRTSCVVTVAAFVVSLGLAVSAASAAPVRWGGNGHWYEAVDGPPINWSQAKAEAEARTYLSVPGYLATITSEGEQQFIETILPAPADDTYLWLGGYQPEGSPEPSGGWTWVTGEPWNYTHWATGHVPLLADQPDDWNEEQDFLMICLYSSGGIFGEWADHYDEPRRGYIVEYVPEPLSLVLLAAGGLSLLRRRR